MVTGIEYRRHIYKVDNVLTSYTIYKLQRVLNQELVSVKDTNSLLPSLVRVEPYEGRSNATGIKHMLRGRNVSKWAKNILTGLRPTIKEGVYYGDHFTGKKNFLVIHFSENRETLVIDYFRGFNPDYPRFRENLISQHKFHL